MGLKAFGLKNQIGVRYLYWADEQTFLGLQLSPKSQFDYKKDSMSVPFKKIMTRLNTFTFKVMKVSWSYTIKEF